jgi:sRNA-binding carbon storage regulator CsrA
MKKIILLISILMLSLNLNASIIEGNEIKLKVLNIRKQYDRVISCSKLPTEIWILDKFLANLKYYQIVECGEYEYIAKKKSWYKKIR